MVGDETSGGVWGLSYGGQAEDRPMHSTSVVIADRHPIVLHGLSHLLGADSDFNVVACCSDGASCIEALRKFVPEIAILGVLIPGVTESEILSIVSSENLSTRVVFFTASDEDYEMVMAAAADGYSVISKHAAPEALLESLREVATGQRLLPMLSVRDVLQEKSAIVQNALTTLTERERQIMRLVSEGLSNKEIGRRLNISDGTIKVHLHHIFRKLEISNRTVLAALAIAQNDRASAPEDKPPLPIWSD
jgi:two-component system, NarL family, nitrate/nitrite response regulator NarL